MSMSWSDSRVRRSSFGALLEAWTEAEGETKLVFEQALKARWETAWAAGKASSKAAALEFISVLPLEEGQDVIWDALQSPHPVIRREAVKSAVRFFARSKGAPSARAIEALWAYLLDTDNRLRKLAYLTLERIHGLAGDERIFKLKNDPDLDIREDARRETAGLDQERQQTN